MWGHPRHTIFLRHIAMLCFLAVCGCTTQSYFRDDGVKVTVKKFAGVPYLETKERTRVVPVGSEN
jgi:hypothetical protein